MVHGAVVANEMFTLLAMRFQVEDEEVSNLKAWRS